VVIGSKDHDALTDALAAPIHGTYRGTATFNFGKDHRLVVHFDSFDRGTGAITGRVEWPDVDAIKGFQGKWDRGKIQVRENSWIKYSPNALFEIEYEFEIGANQHELKGAWKNFGLGGAITLSR
jgi:hypothetical protein